MKINIELLCILLLTLSHQATLPDLLDDLDAVIVEGGDGAEPALLQGNAAGFDQHDLMAETDLLHSVEEEAKGAVAKKYKVRDKIRFFENINKKPAPEPAKAKERDLRRQYGRLWMNEKEFEEFLSNLNKDIDEHLARVEHQAAARHLVDFESYASTVPSEILDRVRAAQDGGIDVSNVEGLLKKFDKFASELLAIQMAREASKAAYDIHKSQYNALQLQSEEGYAKYIECTTPPPRPVLPEDATEQERELYTSEVEAWEAEAEKHKIRVKENNTAYFQANIALSKQRMKEIDGQEKETVKNNVYAFFEECICAMLGELSQRIIKGIGSASVQHVDSYTVDVPPSVSLYMPVQKETRDAIFIATEAGAPQDSHYLHLPETLVVSADKGPFGTVRYIVAGHDHAFCELVYMMPSLEALHGPRGLYDVQAIVRYQLLFAALFKNPIVIVNLSLFHQYGIPAEAVKQFYIDDAAKINELGMSGVKFLSIIFCNDTM